MIFQIVFVDSSDMCNDLGFNIGSGTSTVTRSWRIKVRLVAINTINVDFNQVTFFRSLNMTAIMITLLLMAAPSISFVRHLT